MVTRLPEAWLAFCRKGKIGFAHQCRAVESCVASDGSVRGHYSDLLLNPTVPETHSLYPSHDHTTSPRDHRSMVVDARLINDMKSHLSEAEFWLVIEHLYAIGRSKEQIPLRSPQRLPGNWVPSRNF